MSKKSISEMPTIVAQSLETAMHETQISDNAQQANLNVGEPTSAEDCMPQPEIAIEGSSAPSNTEPPADKKRKTKKKSKTERQATGFEEYYVDPPLTPEQHSEEIGLYDASRPFMERIEIAIQRYVAKRNLDSDRKNLFDKYLKFGGIDSGPKMFSGGLDARTLADSTAAEIAFLRAMHVVPIERAEDSVVDFEVCLKAFLSSPIIFTFDLSRRENIQRYVGVIKNFLNYLLHHDVCPEYKVQIEDANKTCAKGESEIWSIVQAQPLLPGSFNMACSELFGGKYRGMYDPACEEWMDEADKSGGILGLSHEKAGKVFTIGFAAYGTDDQLLEYKKAKSEEAKMASNPYKPKTREMDLQITKIELGRTKQDVITLYQSERAKDLPILGKLRAKLWKSPIAMAQDLTLQEEASLPSDSEPLRELEFWVDDTLLEKFHVGMYLEATIKELSFGIFYFDAVQMLRPTFFTSLANEHMLDWRKVESEWLSPRTKECDQKPQEKTDGYDEHT